MSTWSHLHDSMLSLIAINLTDVNDHLTFAAVCSSWRSVALDIRPTFPCPLPHLMVRGKDDYGYCISLSHGRLLSKKLCIPHGDWYIGSHGGWLVTVHENLNMSLYNPFSKDRLLLPSITSVPYFGEAYYNKDNKYVESAALSSSNINMNPKDLIVMLVQGAYRRLAFAKPGDSSWEIIEFEDDEGHFYYSDVTFFKGKFYAVGYRGTVMCEDVGLNPKVTLLFPGTKPNLPTDYECRRRYLIESQSGDLIMVERYIMDNDEEELDPPTFFKKVNENSAPNDRYIYPGMDDESVYSTVESKRAENDEASNQRWMYKTMYFIAYKMDFVAQQWSPLQGIGDDQVFFVGFNSALALKVEMGKGNRIYFTDDDEEAQVTEIAVHGKFCTRDMGVFNFNDDTVSPHVDIGDGVRYPPPMWAIPLPW